MSRKGKFRGRIKNYIKSDSAFKEKKQKREFEYMKAKIESMAEKTPVFHRGFGIGLIEKKEENDIYIRFLKEQDIHKMSIAMACQALEVLPKWDIKVLKAFEFNKLQKKVKEDPFWTFRILIKSYNGVVSLEEVRKELEGSVVENYVSWQKSAIISISEDPHFIQTTKNGRLAYSYTKEPQNTTTKSQLDTLIIPPRYSIHIRQHSFRCTAKNHKIIPLQTSIPVKTTKQIKLVEVFVDYCIQCNQFSISNEEFSTKLWPFRNNLLKYFVGDTGQNYGPKPEFRIETLRKESALKKAGYSVARQDDLSPSSRHRILDEVIRYGILEVSMVKNYLQYYISFLGVKPSMEEAVVKWRFDLEYINKTYSKQLTDSFFNWIEKLHK